MGSLLQLSHVANLIPTEDAELFRDRVADLLQRKNRGFPGAQPVSFSKSHLTQLQKDEYVYITPSHQLVEADRWMKSYYLCEKTDGIRCLLFLTFIIGEEGRKIEAAFLIDRKNDYYHIDNPHFHFPLPNAPLDSFHVGTLLDGELVLDTYPAPRPAIRRYLVFDCLAIDDKDLIHRTLDKRLAYFHERVLKPYNDLFQKYPEERTEQPFEVRVKKMEKAYGIEMMFKDVLPSLPHGNDGLVFTCRTSEYTIGTDRKIIKWKPPAENTIDFRLQIGRFPAVNGEEGVFAEWDGDEELDFNACPEFKLLVSHGGGQHKEFASLYVTDDEWTSMKALNTELDGRIIECHKDEQSRWRYKHEKDGSPRFRDDKTDANFRTVVESVLESINDAISEQDLLAHVGEIRAGWKERERLENEKLKQEETQR